MQYNYIFMEEIQGEHKLEVSRTMKNCQDIELFEQESVQHIIDFKWNKYAKDFFLFKFFMYVVFLTVYYLDLESTHYADDDGNRIKGYMFFGFKAVEFIIQFLFFVYELVQVKLEKRDYFEDIWNYFELLGIFLFAWAAVLDIQNPKITDTMQILFALSTLLTLVKVVYLIRVFRQLNFLVTMFITVVHEIQHFMILFIIFIITFAEAFHVVRIDITPYGRINESLALVIAVLRCAMGDFAMVDMYQGFDLYTTDE